MKPTTQLKRKADAAPIRILLVDDHPAVRHGLALLLASERMEVSAQAGARVEALAHLKERHPGLAIVDLSLNGEDGLALVADLHQRSIPVLVYSMHNNASPVQNAFAAGALGYVTKRELDSVLVQDLHAPADGLGKLSVREREVHELLGRGESTAEIAAAMQISTRTVESYCERIQVKLGLNGMHELRRHAIQHFQKHSR